ncbi:Cell division topological specificity factor MinE [hydrothermal vent metagenome]|uniref:Cell division topological specificity factor MinE n=1 Tax=hydrothermal vent metagenome TaxID=652676 RepID=A0A3B0Z8A4_9ZZZZ
MSILDYLLRRQKKTATVAKDRLQIILAREHTNRDGPDYLPAMKRDILVVISRYIDINMDDIQVNLDNDGDCEILELNIVLPESEDEIKQAAHH